MRCSFSTKNLFLFFYIFTSWCVLTAVLSEATPEAALSRRQVRCLLCHSLLGTLRSSSREVTFARWLGRSRGEREGHPTDRSKKLYLRCLFRYLGRAAEEEGAEDDRYCAYTQFCWLM